MTGRRRRREKEEERWGGEKGETLSLCLWVGLSPRPGTQLVTRVAPVKGKESRGRQKERERQTLLMDSSLACNTRARPCSKGKKDAQQNSGESKEGRAEKSLQHPRSHFAWRARDIQGRVGEAINGSPGRPSPSSHSSSLHSHKLVLFIQVV